VNDLKPDRAGIIAPPPVIYLAALAAGLAAEWQLPLALSLGDVKRFVGWSLVGVGGLLLLWAARALRRARTSVSPYKPTSVLVVDGPYRYSRNPIYLADALIYIGISVVIDTLWPILLLPIALAVLQQGVIAREERYLERKFGDQYRQYQASVRRWL
jgi:protein-S-isoprenylcysteine O-methyltransferase Ste14